MYGLASQLRHPRPAPSSGEFPRTRGTQTLVSAHRHLAELKGCAASIPNQAILINALALQEAKASSEVESYVTTQDELFQADLHLAEWVPPAVKEVSRYREALRHGFERMRQQQGILSNGTLIALFQLLKNSNEGLFPHQWRHRAQERKNRRYGVRAPARRSKRPASHAGAGTLH